MKRKWILYVAIVLVVVGIILDYFIGGMFSTGEYVLDYFAAGKFAAGIFSIGTFSVGVFSIGIFSIGIFSLSIFNIGIYTVGFFLIGYKKRYPKFNNSQKRRCYNKLKNKQVGTPACAKSASVSVSTDGGFMKDFRI